MLIDPDRGHIIELGHIDDEDVATEIKHALTHCVPKIGEFLSDHVDAYVVEDDELQYPQACGRGLL